MKKQKLKLNRETVRQLTDDTLRIVIGGGDHPPTWSADGQHGTSCNSQCPGTDRCGGGTGRTAGYTDCWGCTLVTF
jgi:hypothetical protein